MIELIPGSYITGYFRKIKSGSYIVTNKSKNTGRIFFKNRDLTLIIPPFKTRHVDFRCRDEFEVDEMLQLNKEK